MKKYFDYYRAGQVNGKGAVLWMFRYYRADGTFGSCEAVEEQEVAAHRKALAGIGWKLHPRCPVGHLIAEG